MKNIKSRRFRLIPFDSLVGTHKTSANLGPDWRFIVEEIFKPLVPKSSQSSIMITQNCAHSKHEFRPIFELFSNNNTRSSYSPKFGAHDVLVQNDSPVHVDAGLSKHQEPEIHVGSCCIEGIVDQHATIRNPQSCKYENDTGQHLHNLKQIGTIFFISEYK